MERATSQTHASTAGRAARSAPPRPAAARPPPPPARHGRRAGRAAAGGLDSLDDQAEAFLAAPRTGGAPATPGGGGGGGGGAWPSEGARQRALDDLKSVVPDPHEASLFAEDDEPGAAGALSSSLDLEDWDGVGPAGALWSGGALSSLPYREDDGAGGAGAGGGAAAAAGGGAAGGGAPGAPSYRGGGAAAAPDARAPRTYGAAALPTLGLLGAAPAPTAEAAALEDFLRERAVDAAMVLHHAAAEADLNRYAGTMRLAALLEAVEQEDVRLGAAPMLPGTGQKVPSWIRAREALHPELPALHAAQVAAEAAASAAAVRAARERLLDEVAAAAALLAETRPAAGLARDDATAAAAEADLTLDDLMMDVLPGAAPAPDDGSDFLDELVPGGGHFPLSAADIEALSGEGPGGRRRGGAAAAARTARADALEAAHRGDSALESAEGEGEGEGASSAAEESEVEAEGEGLAEEMADADADAEAILE